MACFHVRGAAILCSSVTALFLLAGGASAQEKLDAHAQLCEDFDQNVIIGGKIADASKYLTSDFIEHNTRLMAKGLDDFTEKLKAFRANMAGRGGRGGRQGGGAPPQRTVLSHDDVVVFITAIPLRDDPNNPGKKIGGGNHFDVYRLSGGKIAEHWD
jgi:predicted SnoaL-like aldol condensation-catalyzing enzyme